jgi:predicted signal transduction protein with EAL and GGDEF domain
VCRQGGDEFVILLSEIERSQDAALTAEKLLQAIAEPHMVDTHELHVGLSIGIAVYPGDGDTAETLMQNADAAMYHAKLIGRNNYQFFKMEMNARAVQRAFIESSLRRAIKREEFVLHFQPKMDIASGTVIGAEALLRWQDPKMGLVYPADFLAIAEESGLIVPIGGWVLRAACKQLREWLHAGLRIMPVAINISAAELKHKYFLDAIAQVLKETGLPPYYLELEFTETILMRDPEFAVQRLEALREIGVQIAVDDFGTGYSSLSYLKRFPVGTLKIDPSFMRDLDVDGDNATIVSAIIAMGRNLKQRVLAEGVETADQLAFLRNHRCHEAQGFYLSHPMPAEEFARLLVTNALPVLCVRQRTETG